VRAKFVLLVNFTYVPQEETTFNKMLCWLLVFLSVTQCTPQHPQYLIVNKALGSTDPLSWRQEVPQSCNQASFDDIISRFKTKGNERRRLGVSNQITLLDGTQNGNYLEFLDRLLSMSETNDLPVALGLDPFQFWSSRPDLWNWFDPNSPGYDPKNIENVEWASWSSVNATTIAWRDWGSQFRVPPHPNLSSPKVLAAYLKALDPVVEKVGVWYKSLPASKKYLLAWIKVTWEVCISQNFYYYQDGNRYRTQDPKSDPKIGISGAVQQGYNAVCTAGLACSGTITVAHLDAVLSNYFSVVASRMETGGIPRTKLVTHEGGNFGDLPYGLSLWNSPQAAVVPQAQPGWSFYRFAYNPSDAEGLDTALDAISGAAWGASEWYYMGGINGTAREQWLASFNNTISYRNCRLVDVFNWEALKKDEDGLWALGEMLNSSPSCLVDPVQNLKVEVSGDSAIFTWTDGVDIDHSFLDVSILPYTLPSGPLASPTVVNRLEVSKNSITVNLAKYKGALLWASVVSIGCSGAQMMVSEKIGWTM
jgi:hypothetical protein